jgi:phosphoribosyl-ATP pyrophosphohydrolase/phosphoribosyl-AMP cyclohydrolase/histidinol dehydrogenase
MSFSQVPFLPLLEAAPDAAQAPLLAALARITPLLIPSSLFEATKPTLPSSAEYYILQDSELSLDQVVAYLDGGAQKLVSKDVGLIGQISADRFVLRIDAPTAYYLNDPTILAGISAVLLDTASFAENLLKSFRSALNLAAGRPRELFILSSNRTPEVILHQPASLKLMSKTVGGTAVLPISFLSTTFSTNNLAPQPENDQLSITTLFTSTLRSDRTDGLFPTIPVSLSSVPTSLGLVYSSAASISNSILSGNAVYYSRSRNGLWKKGETSGAMQMVERIRYDCDADALEFGVLETGPNGEKDGFCHIPDQVSCFGGQSGLRELESTLRSRMKDAPKGSYTARLFAEPALLKAKIMEEAAELCEAETKEDIAAEAADLLYFALAKCVAAGVGLREVTKILDARSLKVTRRKGDAKKEWVEKLGLKEGQAEGVAGGVAGVAAVAAPATNGTKVEAPLDPATDLRCQTYDLAVATPAVRKSLLKRPLMASSDIMSRVAPILATVREGGDAGLRSLVHKFDRCDAAADAAFPLVLNAPFPPELMVIEPKVKAAIDQAYSNIHKFHNAQMDKERNTLVVETMPGVVCSRFARPIERVGLYVPGGTAVLPSTALMLSIPAQVAGSSVVILATPPRANGSISPEIVYIASLSGVATIVKAGGAQGVAAMAYGTETVPKVDKIFGPGNQYVTAAKMSISMDSSVGTSIDMPAGPSEVLVSPAQPPS